MSDDGIYRLGGSGDAISTLQALAPRYPKPIILTRLIKIIIGTSSGGNKDAPLFELCHLINAADAAGYHGQNGLLTFFMEPETIWPSHFKRIFSECSEHEQWRRGGFSANDTHVLIDYNDTTFSIHYGRMPLLGALFEFLSTMEGFLFFNEFNDILKEMLAGGVGVEKIKAASNRVASRLRKYRLTHIDLSKNKERFDKILKFLHPDPTDNYKKVMERLWSASDEDIFAFWQLHSTGQEFRGYKTVFDHFVDVLRFIQRQQVSSSVQSADVLGLDKDQGEIDPRNPDISTEPIDAQIQGQVAKLEARLNKGLLSQEEYAKKREAVLNKFLGFSASSFPRSEWENPLSFFDQDKLKNIKFLKGTSERQPIENLMKYGPYACRFPQAFLRLECFSPIQSAITNDLQMKRGNDWIIERISCDDAISYDMKIQVYKDIARHLRVLQLAIWHIISGSETATDHDEVSQHDARMAFESLRRKGFETPNVDEDRRSDFSSAGEEIVKMSDQIKQFIDTVEALNLDSSEVFASDKEKFSCQLHKIYGAIDE